MVPTRELAEQVSTHLLSLLVYCETYIRVSNASAGTSVQEIRELVDKPDIVVATPARVLTLLQSKTLSLSSLVCLVIDEADLILSYGYDQDVRQILSGSFLPKIHQSFLMSATMTEDIELLQGMTLHNPAVLILEDETEAANLSQFAVRCSEVDKFLLTYVILKLKLVRGKCIFFVNNVERSYRLKLFLEQFSINSCVLNSELPLNSRYHTVQQFNKGVYDYIIATDESGAIESVSKSEKDDAEDFAPTQRETLQGIQDTSRQKRKRGHSPKPAVSISHKKKHKKNRDKEYGVTRGVDFIDVSCVVNFDLPTTSQSYTHRIGRTARAGRTGMSLSFVVPRNQWGTDKVLGCLPSAKTDEVVFSVIEKEQKEKGSKIKEYNFNMKQVEAFRYRMEDALRSVTRIAIKEARIKELKSEILNSDRLKAHFEDHPLDLEYLRHDKPLHPTRIQPHMKHVPKYLLPKIAPVSGADGVDGTLEQNSTFVPFKKKKHGKGSRTGARIGRSGVKKPDPLKKFRR